MIHHGVEQAARRSGDRPAVLAGDETWSYRQLDQSARAVARHLADAGVQPGARVAVAMSNRPEFLAAVYGISQAGAVSVLMSTAWKTLESRHALELTGATHAIVDEAGATVADLLPLARVSQVDAIDPGPTDFDAQFAAPDRDAVMVFSSGTTGLPKAVRHTHVSLAHATAHWCAALGLGPHDRFQVATPPSHILGLLNLLAAVSAQATVRLHRRFDLDEELGRIASERMTVEMAVAPIALALANHPELERYDLTSLRYIMWGATPVTPSVAERVTERTGVRWLPAYGASELPVLAANPVDDPGRWRLDSAGLPPAGVELRVADLDTGEVMKPGGVGEIQARSASVMAGYLPDQANQEAFVDGWYRTGDVGWLEPEGWVHITDRCKEMIKVKGFQVAPAEIEAVLHGHPSVVDCAVFGVDDDAAGELPVAAVQLDAGRPVPIGELEKLVADSLASYKQLHQVVVVDSIPRLPSGKVLRRMLRDEWAPNVEKEAR